ncbi:MAG: prephenate dehydrogenase [Oscillospiraceae bacterium]|jgi:prephenate dehydrogenase|nr:prephenate dehydrogenase [Oscillospiraceae bacterium]
MTVGIVGLGLIGGSLAKAYHAQQHRVLAYDRDESITQFAIMAQAVDAPLCAQNIASCDLILLAVYPQAALQWLRQAASSINPAALVLDCCGTKREICREAFPLAQKHGWLFVGGHPMAGTHFSGFKYSRATLFKGAPMALVPPVFDDMQLLARVQTALLPLELGAIRVCTAEEHDAIIAFTSQLAHIVSNAYVKSPTAMQRKGISAGSFRDLTRVAWLNAQMWTQLFMENRDHLLAELDGLIGSLQEYKSALADGDDALLRSLLEDGKTRKEALDKS